MTQTLQTNDLSRAHRVARRLESGSVWVNYHSDLSRKARMAATSRVAPDGPAGWRAYVNSSGSKTSASPSGRELPKLSAPC